MTIKYVVQSNPLKPGTFYPRVIRGERIPAQRINKDVADDMAISESTVEGVLKHVARRAAYYLLDGDLPAIEGLATLSVSLSDEEMPNVEATLSDQAELNVNINPISGLLNAVRKDVSFAKVYVQERKPTLLSLHDVRADVRNAYTADRSARLRGDSMRFDPAAEDEGIFFVAVSDGTAVRAEHYARIGGREIIFDAPPGLTGEQYVEVHTRYAGKTLRAGRMKETVNPAG